VRVSVRPLRHSDLVHVLAIEQRSFPVPWSLGMFVLELGKPSSICSAATVADRLVGYLIAAEYGDAWHLMNISVDDRWRRQGIADALLTDLFARQNAVDVAYTLEVRRSNSAAIRLYQRHGFAAVGVRKHYYQDNGEDGVIMWRTV